MSDWNEYKLSDIVDIKHGYAFKGELFSDEPTKNILVTPGNFKIGGGYKDDKLKYYKGDIPKDYILSHKDIIVTMTDLSKQADTLGFSAKVPNDNTKVFLHNQRIGLLQFKDDTFSHEFLYWLMRAEHYQKFVAGSSTGATVKHTSPTKIRAFKFKAPSNDIVRKKIAKILSNYDDLIENNLKRIKLLEESARLTYEEWFLRFRIDGEKLEVDSETGLPLGWEKKKFISLCKNFTDGTHDSPKAIEADNSYYLITGKHLANNEINFSTAYKISEDDHLKIMKRSGLQNRDILFSNIGTLGQVAMVNEFIDFSCKNVFIFRALENTECFLFEFLKYEPNKENFIAQSSGSTQKFISLQYMRQFKTVIAPNDFLYKFNENIKPIYNELDNLRKQNQLLKEARDILLPRLMTGMIDVEDMEITL